MVRSIDERFKRFNGYIAGRNIALSRKSDNYYRIALDKELDKYIQTMLNEVEDEYKPVEQGEELKSGIFEAFFNKWNFAMLAILLANSDKIVNKWLSLTRHDVSQSVQKMAYGLAEKSVAVTKTPEYEEMLRLIVQRNVQLIKNVTTQTMTNIENIIYDGILAHQKWSTIRKDLNHQKELSRKRMKFIAKDQTAKARELINRQEQLAVGIEYFRWVTVGDERVRKSHRKLNGKIFKWNDDPSRLPILNDKGDRGYPAEDYGCRCSAIGVIILDGYKAVWNDSTESYEVVKNA